MLKNRFRPFSQLQGALIHRRQGLARSVLALARRAKAATRAAKARACPRRGAAVWPDSSRGQATRLGALRAGGLSGGVVPHPWDGSQKPPGKRRRRGVSADKMLKNSCVPLFCAQGRWMKGMIGRNHIPADMFVTIRPDGVPTTAAVPRAAVVRFLWSSPLPGLPL